jgi:amino acid adenylation domain-containing protein
MAYLLHQLLTRSAERHPDKAAVSVGGRTLTYRDLDAQSNQLAHFLRERGLRKGDRVGMFFPKAVESLVAMLGIGKAGGVYVPMDAQQPVQRTAYLIQNCAMSGVITNGALLQALGPALNVPLGFALVTGDLPAGSGWCPTFAWSSLNGAPSNKVPACGETSMDLAYILYTSGSTGRPKGVMISHLNALTFVNWCSETFRIRPEDRLSNHAPLHFDLSVFDIYNALEAGATVCIVPPEIAAFPSSLAGWIESQQITVWYSVPSALILLLLHATARLTGLKRLRTVLFAGDVFPMKYLRQLADLLPEAEMYNLYGPTETNVCTYYKVDRGLLASQERLPVGRGCENTEVFAVTDRNTVAQTGETGELYVRGPGVTCGYWGDADKTRKMFVPHPFQPYLEDKVYKTGDLVKLLEDGSYDFLGRIDSMVKSRGYRIELGEIEAALLSHPGVREASAIPLRDEEIGARIKAVIVAHDGAELSTTALLQHCNSRIPKYMIPEFIEFRDTLPKTSTGKIDRVKLASEAAPVARVG